MYKGPACRSAEGDRWEQPNYEIRIKDRLRDFLVAAFDKLKPPPNRPRRFSTSSSPTRTHCSGC
jgi:hypothetical protein